MMILNIVGPKATYLKIPKRTAFIAQSEQCQKRDFIVPKDDCMAKTHCLTLPFLNLHLKYIYILNLHL